MKLITSGQTGKLEGGSSALAAPLVLLLTALLAALLQPTAAPGIATATNHHVDYQRLGMAAPSAGRVIGQPHNLYEHDVALPTPGTLKCRNSQQHRDP